MATRQAGEKRGPKIGDAASLWNFTPSPGWTKEEAHVLKLCLMKLGIGRWVQILETGLLPGKLIQQLNGQTQRLLGQQSLAAYTGLQVDIDRIRIDNETRTDAPRKAGLIINTGANLTKDVKEKMQAEARKKYSLTPQQIKDADDQIKELMATAQASVGVSEEDAALLSADPSTLSTTDKVAVLKLLHTRLRRLQTTMTTYTAAQLQKQQQKQTAQKSKSTLPSTSNQENGTNNSAGGPSRTAKRKSAGSMPNRAPRRGKKNADPGSSSDDDDMTNEGDRGDVEMGDAGVAAETAAAVNAALNADVATLVAMGFGERQVRDALEEVDGSVEMAAEWLMTHCV